MILNDVIKKISNLVKDTSIVEYTLNDRVDDINSNYRSLIRQINFYKGIEWTNNDNDNNRQEFILSANTNKLLVENDYEIDRVEIKVNNNWIKLKKFIQEDYDNSVSDLLQEKGTPEFYIEKDGSIDMFPMPTTNTTVAVFKSNKPQNFTTTNLNSEIRLPEFAVDYLAFKSSADYFDRTGYEIPKSWLLDISRIEKLLEKHYAPTRIIKIKERVIDRPL